MDPWSFVFFVFRCSKPWSVAGRNIFFNMFHLWLRLESSGVFGGCFFWLFRALERVPWVIFSEIPLAADLDLLGIVCGLFCWRASKSKILPCKKVEKIRVAGTEDASLVCINLDHEESKRIQKNLIQSRRPSQTSRQAACFFAFAGLGPFSPWKTTSG